MSLDSKEQPPSYFEAVGETSTATHSTPSVQRERPIQEIVSKQCRCRGSPRGLHRGCRRNLGAGTVYGHPRHGGLVGLAIMGVGYAIDKISEKKARNILPGDPKLGGVLCPKCKGQGIRDDDLVCVTCQGYGRIGK
ncbi:hypothetical protein KL935_003467 [Ogataea polymorpha]|nr:hypothetical protein KL937_002249 [Ogataea polymorpha]KAG7894482.1 hypothetical protein KL908_001854 [Ogataea polymorpha]KAG7899926.1 hypothetical protein KL935_003467 [Ogataea polymorpha]KAG7917712.1 hypothetical protein KL927_002455 [Ogataea polymorpha]KAG7934753.1 hypothetical protein KL934_002679 [Ogataea polymorpha]